MFGVRGCDGFWCLLGDAEDWLQRNCEVGFHWLPDVQCVSVSPDQCWLAAVTSGFVFLYSTDSLGKVWHLGENRSLSNL
jgi:hypothetical protein